MSPCAAPISTMPKYILEIQHYSNLFVCCVKIQETNLK